MSYLNPPGPRSLGNTGLSIGPVAWGMWRFKGADVTAAQARVEAALAAGVALFDTADIYGPDNGEPFGAAESLLGRVLAQAKELRDRMVIATKGGIVIGTPYDSSPSYLASAIDASLRRLNIDRAELYQLHRPDILAHPQETARALDDAYRAGKIAAIGVSNFTPAQTAALAHFLTVPLASTQPEFSPLRIAPLGDGLFDQAMTMDLAVLAWSPLAGGRVASPAEDRARAVAAALDAKATEFGVSRAAAACSWIMAHPARPIPIAGTQDVARIAELADALRPRWTRADWYSVLSASMGEPLP